MKHIILASLTAIILASVFVAGIPQFGAEAPSVLVSGNNIIITGQVIDSVEGTNVELFCGSNKAGENQVLNGSFTITTVYGSSGCNSGIAMLKMQESETSVNIPASFIVVPKGGKSKDAPDEPKALFFSSNSLSTEQSNTQVPEFSTLALGIAVVTVSLGITFMRKT